MHILQKADAVFRQSIREAQGYLSLCQMAREAGRDDRALRDHALRALRRFSDDEELIDAIYDADVWVAVGE